MRARTQAQWGGVAMACDHFRYPAVNKIYFIFCFVVVLILIMRSGLGD